MRHIAIGVCTFKNPTGLKKLLQSLSEQQYDTSGLKVTVIVVDNDCTGVNRDLINALTPTYQYPIIFIEEKEQGIPFARNASVRAALKLMPDAFIFIDDDEYAPPDWLRKITTAWLYSAALVITGPVHHVYTGNAPNWVIKGNAFQNITENYQNNQKIAMAYTNNTLVDIKVLVKMGATFDPTYRFSGGEDHEYFRRVFLSEFYIMWRVDCFIYEDVPDYRTTLSWYIKRQIRIGAGITKTELKLYPTWRTLWRCTLLAIRQTSLIVNLFAGACTGNYPRSIRGLRSFLVGIGVILGMVGYEYREYTKNYR